MITQINDGAFLRMFIMLCYSTIIPLIFDRLDYVIYCDVLEFKTLIPFFSYST